MAVYKDENKTKDGRSWYFKTYKKDFNGTNKAYKSKKYLRKTDAEEAERIFLMKRDNPLHKKFALVAKDYFDYIEKTRKASTYDTQFRDYNKHIKKYFENFYIDNIEITDLKNWMEKINKQNYSLNYSNKLYSTLSNILDYAITNFGLSDNKLKKIGRFQRKKDAIISNEEKLRYITFEQFEQFISVIDDPLWNTFFYFCYYTGMRKGEIVALKWTDIDFKNKIIHVNKTLYSKIKGKTGDNVVINNTKNYINRDIKISSKLYDKLYAYKKIVEKYINYNENWYVFGNTTYLANATMDRIKDNAFIKCGIPKITMHEFRHSHVSLLINEYVKVSREKNMKIDTAKFFLMMSSRMGHTVDVMQKTYMHLFPTIQDEIVDLLDNL